MTATVYQESLFDYDPHPIDEGQIIKPKFQIRPYQKDAIDDFFSKLVDEGYRSAIGVLATGLGKTVIAGFFGLKWNQDCGGRILFLAHREELIDQAEGTFRKIFGHESVTVEQGDRYASISPKIKVVIASTASIFRDDRLNRFPPDFFGCLIIDECHHFAKKNKQYSRVVDYFLKAKYIGLTATPDRTDELAMGQVFDTGLERQYDVLWGRDEGWLVPVRVQLVTIEGLDFSNVRLTKKNDLNEVDMSNILSQESALAGIVYPVIEASNKKNRWWNGRPRRALVFAASVHHARKMAEIFNREHEINGTGKADVIYSQAVGINPMPKDQRREIIRKFRSGEITYLCNYGIATEGFDVDSIQIVGIARKTKSRALFSQMIGRGTRPWYEIVEALNNAKSADERKAIIANSKKPGLLVIDTVGVSGRHKLVTPFDVLGGRYDDNVTKEAFEMVSKKPGGLADIDQALRESRDILEKKERERLKNVTYSVQYKSKIIDPFNVLQVFGEREPGWFKGKLPTEKQKALLEKQGYTEKELSNFTFYQASRIISEIIKRRKENKCTIKQARILQRYGYSPNSSFAEASKILDDLQKQNWPDPGRYKPNVS